MKSRRCLLLGIDTGGTYTDAVVYDDLAGEILGKSKAETTHDDLAIGIDEAIAGAVADAEISGSELELVSMSTTLATNALVENKGRAACLVSIGFDAEALERAGLRGALDAGEVIVLAGGHTSHGIEVEQLDLDVLAEAVDSVSDDVDAFAVTSQFSVRNPAHELAASQLIRERTGKPVTCSHHLSSNLNGPKRAVTAMLNARLVAMITDLVNTTLGTLASRDVHAPLMVVRGDGSLVSAAYVLERPIETILSGPAASLIGARHLLGTPDAVVADIGGTTTDIAILRDGEPELTLEGATVGGHRTMVEAVAMHTHGLGGDSQISVAPRASGPELLIGPHRVQPVCLMARHHTEAVHQVLDRQLAADQPSELDAVLLAVAATGKGRPRLTSHERGLLDTLGERVLAADEVVTSGLEQRSLARLIGRGLIRASGFTPTDASHVLGHQTGFDTDAALKAATLFARRRDRFGKPIATDASELSALVVSTLIRRSAEALLGACFAHEDLGYENSASELVAASLDRTTKTARVDIGIAVPLIALGASAAIYYPDIAQLLRADLIVPDHADVANAIGAAVGRIRITHEVVISAPRRGFFRVHQGTEPLTLPDLDEAKLRARDGLVERVTAEMHRAGASTFEIEESWNETTVDVESRPMFVEGVYAVRASGRPDLG